MQALQRNQLVWLTDGGWQQVLARRWDAQAQTILQHWHAHRLPLVACSQRAHHTPATVSLGLPAPTRWGRRKLALEVLPQAVEHTGLFPALELVAQRHFTEPGAAQVLAHLLALQVPLQVYGSFGWQHLTSLDYVRPTSDLDLRAQVPDHASARAAARALHALQLPLRVDGELAFPDGSAIAWREYLQWLDGKVDRVLVKTRMGIQLADLAGQANAEVAACAP